MQPCSREMVGMNNNDNNSNNASSLLNHSQIPSLVQQDNHLHHHHHHAQPSHFPHAAPLPTDDFLDQMFSSLPSCSWPDLNPNMLPITEPATSAADDVGGFHQPPHPHSLDDQSAILVSKLRQHQISGGGGGAPSSSAAAARALMLQQQLLAHQNDGVFDGSAVFNNNNNGFGGSSLHGVAGQTSNPQRPPFNHPQGHGAGSIQRQVTPNFSAQGSVTNQLGAAASASTGGAPGQPRQRVRARRGQATDPHSIAERLRRERIAERMKALQELVPNANKTDKASMLDEIIDYVKFLQLQVKVLSMSRLGGAAAVAPLVADVTSEGGGDCNQTSPNGRGNTSTNASSANDSLTVTEHQVAKLMEEDMGSAMQYLQGKGLCLMPISLATAISTATCRSGRPISNNGVYASNADGPTSPSMSVLTVQSANNVCNGSGGVDVSVKDAASVSKP